MKKFCLCLLLALCMAAPQCASACGAEEYLLSMPNTADAVCLTWGGYCAVGVRTKGILMKSQSEKYVAEITDEVKKRLPETTTVYVTTDLKEIMIRKQVKKMLADGKSPMSVYRYISQKYPWLLDKLSLPS